MADTFKKITLIYDEPIDGIIYNIIVLDENKEQITKIKIEDYTRMLMKRKNQMEYDAVFHDDGSFDIIYSVTPK